MGDDATMAGPPELPEIHDEAGDTPLWVPALGASLLALVTLFLVLRAAIADFEAEQAEAEAPAAAAPADPEAAPTE